MKKLLYIFLTVLIVACSGDDSADINSNNLSEKNIVNIEILEEDDLCIEGANYNYNYDGDKITLATEQYYLSSCLSQGYIDWEYSEPINIEYQYFSDRIVVSDNNTVISEIYFDNNRHITSDNAEIIFENGYLTKFGATNLEWQDGNLIRVINNSNIVEYTYSNILNKTGFIGNPGFSSYSDNDGNIPFILFGLFGGNSSELPMSQTQYYDDETNIFNYDYILDDDGYPIYVNVGETSDYNNEIYERNFTMKLTYAN